MDLDQSVVRSHSFELDLDCVLECELEQTRLSFSQSLFDPCLTLVMSETSKPRPPVQVSLSVLLFDHMGVSFPSKCPVVSVQLTRKKNRRDKRRTEEGDFLLPRAKINLLFTRRKCTIEREKHKCLRTFPLFQR